MANEKPLNQELTSYALKLSKEKGAEYAEATIEHSESQSYVLKQGKMDAAGSDDSTGLRVRFIKDGYLYSSAVKNPTKELVAKLFGVINNFSKKGTVSFPSYPTYKLKYEAKETMEPEPETIIKKFTAIDKEIADSKQVKSRYGVFSYDKTNSLFENMDGSRIESTIPRISAFYSIVVESNGQTRQRMLQPGFVRGIDGMDDMRLAENAIQDAKSMKKVLEEGVNINEVVKNVVISSEIVGIGIHESIGHPLEADRLLGREAAQAGITYLNVDNLGLEIGSDIVTLCDDPTIKNSYGFYLYDEEGVKTGKRTLVKNGKQVDLIHDKSSAQKLGTKSNGSSRSSYVYLEPLPRMANTYMEPNKKNKFEDLIAEAKNGVFIKNFTEWNIDDTRSFSKYQGNEAYLIKNGRLDKPIKNYALESKTLDFWHAVTMVDKEFDFVNGNCGKGEPMQGVPVSMGGPNALLKFK